MRLRLPITGKSEVEFVSQDNRFLQTRVAHSAAEGYYLDLLPRMRYSLLLNEEGLDPGLILLMFGIHLVKQQRSVPETKTGHYTALNYTDRVLRAFVPSVRADDRDVTCEASCLSATESEKTEQHPTEDTASPREPADR